MKTSFLHKVLLEKNWNPEWQKWCSSQYGLQFEKWRCHRVTNDYSNRRYMFYFKHRDDAIHFKMVWG